MKYICLFLAIVGINVMALATPYTDSRTEFNIDLDDYLVGYAEGYVTITLKNSGDGWSPYNYSYGVVNLALSSDDNVYINSAGGSLWSTDYPYYSQNAQYGTKDIELGYIFDTQGTYNLTLSVKQFQYYGGAQLQSANISLRFNVTGGSAHTVTFNTHGAALDCDDCIDGNKKHGSSISGLPSAIVCDQAAADGWYFAGWSETEVADNSASATFVSDPYAPANDIELHAVYGSYNSTITSTTFARATGTFPAAGKYIVLSNMNNPYSMMSNHVQKTNAGLSKVQVGTAAYGSNNMTTTDASIVYEVEDAGGGLVALKNVSMGKYLAATPTDKDLVFVSSKNNSYAKWDVSRWTNANTYCYIKNSAKDAYLYYSSSNYWECRVIAETPTAGTYQTGVYAVNSSSLIQGKFQSAIDCSVKYHVYYEGNADDVTGVVPTDHNEYTIGQQATVLGKNTLAREGYTWLGWSTNKDAVAATYTGTENITIASADVTLYAIWQVKSNTLAVANVDKVVITATPASASAIAEGNNSSVEYGKTITVAYDNVTDGSVFLGWNIYKTGEESTKVPMDGSTFVMPDYNVTVSANIATYANYQTYCPRTVQFDKNGQDAATNWPATITNAKRGSLLTEPAEPSVAGASFQGWFKEPAGENAWDFENDVVGTGDVTTLYAKWGVNQTSVTAYGNGGLYAGDKTTCGPTNFPYGAEVSVSCFPTKADYTFLGYTLTQDGDDYIFNASGESVNRTGYFEDGRWRCMDAELPIYAKWVKTTCDVTYYTGQEGDGGTLIHVTGGALAVIANPVSCDENRYHFEGWTTDGSYAESAEAPTYFDIATQPIMDDMSLYAVWSHGKNVFTKENRGTNAVAAGDKIILVEPTSHLALTSLLLSAEVEEARENVIETDENVYVWDVLAAEGDKLTLRGTNGNLHIGGNTTTSLEVLDNASYASATYKGFVITKSSTPYTYAITQNVAADKTRRVNYNAKKGIWSTLATRTLGNIYRKTGSTGKTYSLDGYCAHEYFATGVSEMTSGKDVAVLSTTGTVAVSHTDKVPVAEKVSGDDVFEVIVNPESTGTNGDGSLNYAYSVKFTPTAANSTYTATYKFVGTGEHVDDTKVIASEEITFTGYSLPDEFAIVVKRGGQYYALPGGIASASTPNAVAVTVEAGEVVDLDASNAYHVSSGTVVSEDRTTVRLITTAGALWATNADNANINDYNGALTAANMSSASEAAKTQTQWTLERVYNESTDAFEGYHLISDANKDKGLFYQNTNTHWGYYSNSYYSGGAYNGEIFFLPIAAQFGDLMDIVEWNSNSVVLNMNGYGANTGNWGVKNAGGTMLLSGHRASDRTLEVSTAALTADQYLNIKVYGNANNVPADPVVESNRNYKIPHVMEGAQSISSAASFSATSILYVKSGTTTVNVNLTVAKVVVCPGAELVVASNKTLTTTDLVLRGRIWSYEQPKLTVNGTLTVNGQTYYTRIVADKSEYYPFGLPKSSSVAAVRLSNGQSVTYGETKNWNLKYYDGQQRADRGDNTVNDWKNLTSGTIAAKTYYIMGSGSAYYREYYFPISLSESVDNTVAIAAYQGASAPDNGWNGFATPYTYVYTNTPAGDPSEFVKVTEKVENNTQWWQHVPSQLYPFFPYFYQTEAAGTLTFGSGLSFAASAPSSVAARAQADADAQVTTQWVQMLLSNGAGESDEANLYVHPTKFTIGYDKQDLTKMKGEGSRPQVWTRMACGDLSFNALPDSVAEGRIPVGLTTGGASNMVFSIGREDYLDRVEAVNLIDDVLGITTNLLENDYTWSTADGVDNRFYLSIEIRRQPQVPTDISDGGGDGGGRDVRKVIFEDKLYIIVDGKVYDATGKTVK